MNELKIFSPSFHKKPLFKEGVVILVDKPLHWTSFNVVAKLRNILSKIEGVKRIKVGHAGTLDPLASGLLILCTGKYTKKIDSIQGMKKEYSGEIQLGATRPSYDMETEVDAVFPTDHLTELNVEEITQQFTGAIEQKPPLFSAIKQDGERLYKKARRGEQIEIKKRPVFISRFLIERKEDHVFSFDVECSKGTYIRSLAYDFGKACDSGGYLKSLRRESIGEYSVNDAWNLDELIAQLEEWKEERKLKDVDRT